MKYSTKYCAHARWRRWFPVHTAHQLFRQRGAKYLLALPKVWTQPRAAAAQPGLWGARPGLWGGQLGLWGTLKSVGLAEPGFGAVETGLCAGRAGEAGGDTGAGPGWGYRRYEEKVVLQRAQMRGGIAILIWESGPLCMSWKPKSWCFSYTWCCLLLLSFQSLETPSLNDCFMLDYSQANINDLNTDIFLIFVDGQFPLSWHGRTRFQQKMVPE